MANLPRRWDYGKVCTANYLISNGAGNGSRTRDLQLGKLPLYQLSYARTPWNGLGIVANPPIRNPRPVSPLSTDN